MARPELTPEEHEPVLVQHIWDRVNKKNKNFIMLFVGATGSGKSYAALRLAEALDDSFDINRVCFKARDFMETINNLVARSEKGEKIEGLVIVWDEFGVEHNAREFMTIANRVINYFFQTSRHLKLIVIMTVPLLSFIDSATRKLCHGIGEMQAINSATKIASVKIKLLQVNVLTGKEYPKYIRYRKKGKMRVAKRMKFSMPSKELRDAYEIKKKAFTTQLNKEIMSKLIDSQEKKEKKKYLTERQEEVLGLLTTMSVEQAASKLGLHPSVIRGNMSGIKKKGFELIPVRQNNWVIRYDVPNYEQKSQKSSIKPKEAHV